jgi:hypothetical protein
VIGRHQFDGLAAEQADAVQFAFVEDEAAEFQIIVDGADQSAAAGG